MTTDPIVAQQPIDPMTRAEQTRQMDARLRAVQNALDACYDVFAEGNPGTIRNSLAELVKVAGAAYRQHTKAINWQSINDALDQLGNPRWDWVVEDTTDAEAVAQHPCPRCGGDRKYETISYWPKHQNYIRLRQHRPHILATCTVCHHVEAIR